MLRSKQFADIVIFVLIAFVIFCGVIAISSSQPHEPANQQHCEEASAEEAKSYQWKCLWKRATDDPVAFFTLLLVCVGGIQLGLFYWQLDLIREGLADTQQAADAAKDHVDTVAKSFAKLERPYLYISDVGDQFRVEQFSPQDVYITYSVANHGKIPAIITNAAAILKTFRYSGSQDVLADGEPIDFVEGHTLLRRPIIASGDIRKDIHEYAVAGSIKGYPIEDNFGAIKGWKNTEPSTYEDIFLWIVISYRGPFTEGHETSICLRWNYGTARWVRHKTNNYEK